MKKIGLIRHGQASFGADNYDKLSALGQVQTQCLGKMFQQSQQKVNKIVSGDMQRQQDSLSNFCQYYQNPDMIKLDNHQGLNEFDHEAVLFKAGLGFHDKLTLSQFLAKQEKPQKVLMQCFNQAIERWQSGQFDQDYDETWQQFQHRSWQALQDIIDQTNDHEYTLIFTSGGVIANLLQQMLALPVKRAVEFNLQIANASITHLLVKRDIMQLQTFNEFSYLYQYQTDVNQSLITWR